MGNRKAAWKLNKPNVWYAHIEFTSLENEPGSVDTLELIAALYIWMILVAHVASRCHHSGGQMLQQLPMTVNS